MNKSVNIKNFLPVKYWKWLFDRKISFFISYPLAVIIIFITHLGTHYIFHPDPIFKVALLVSLTVIISLSLGFGPGVSSALVTGLVIDYYCIHPFGFTTKSPYEHLFILAFITPSLLTSILLSTVRSAFKRTQVSEKIAQSALRDRDVLLEVVAHDLTNPLASILLNCQLVLKAKNEKIDLEKFMTSIMCAGQHMNILIQNLLDASKIREGKFNISKKVNDLVDLVKTLVHEYEALADKRQISLNFESKIDKAKGFFDAEGISQVISNLIGNSLKFTKPGGTIVVKIDKPSAEKLNVEVEDSGVGIAPEFLPFIFDYHWQEKKGGHKSLGLGLFIARAIMLAHKSDIQVRSKINVGTRFSFTVDAVPDKVSPDKISTDKTSHPHPKDHAGNLALAT